MMAIRTAASLDVREISAHLNRHARRRTSAHPLLLMRWSLEGCAMKHRVRIQLTTATRGHVERVVNAGGFFVAGAALSHDGQLKAVVTTPLSVGASQVGEFHSPENILFDGVLDDNGTIAVVLVARYDVVSKDWRTRGEWVEAVEDSIANADARGVA